MVRSPYAHARLKSINTDAAKKVPGVLAIITGEDLAKANLAWMPTLSYDKQMVLATGKVLFQAQEVAFVVAEDRYAAADAAELVEVEYEELPVLVDPHKAMDAERAATARRSHGKKQPDIPLGSRRQSRHRQSLQGGGGGFQGGCAVARAAILRRWRPAAALLITTRPRKNSPSG